MDEKDKRLLAEFTAAALTGLCTGLWDKGDYDDNTFNGSWTILDKDGLERTITTSEMANMAARIGSSALESYKQEIETLKELDEFYNEQ